MKSHTIGKSFCQFYTIYGRIEIIFTTGTNTYEILADKHNNFSKQLTIVKKSGWIELTQIEEYIKKYVL
jgi:hypothetical protein